VGNTRGVVTLITRERYIPLLSSYVPLSHIIILKSTVYFYIIILYNIFLVKLISEIINMKVIIEIDVNDDIVKEIESILEDEIVNVLKELVESEIDDRYERLLNV